MSRIVWDQSGERKVRAGVDHVVLYRKNAGTYSTGEAWNGVTGISEGPEGGEPEDYYADNIVYLSLTGTEKFNFSITAYDSPDSFEECDGTATAVAGVKVTGQNRKPFGLSYRTLIANDEDGMDHGYTLHFVYGALASPSDTDHETVNESPEPEEMSWDCTTTPVAITTKKADGSEYKPTAHLKIVSTDFTDEAAKAKLTALEDIIYGKDDVDARLPLPDEVFTLLGAAG